ncbi:M16 family metallopeptidase [Sphingomonas flavescens]|uniref:M16 family metallopeptidase n=1 Tax=Sphingomonas flavescens TaxID=3132797 RepID=UPI002805D12B|nr:insulinase family protein [Sphingomonas limnosediminicola]
MHSWFRVKVWHAVAAAILCVSSPLAAAQNPWGIASTDVTPDPAIRYGKLPNGLRYAIMHNALPPGAATIEMQYRFGSIGEADNERGLAHFLEHMAFNGTTHVPEGEMEARLQREGLAMGADTNALTGFDTTTYIFNVPKADAERLDSAFFLLREVASEMKLDPVSVNRERAVVLSEGRTRGGFIPNETIDLLRFQLPLAPYWQRLPIGTEAAINGATAATLRSLYQRYYRPENATLIVVGDVDPNAIERKIRASFADWSNPTPSAPPLPRGRVDWTRPEDFHNLINTTRPTIVDYTVLRPWQSAPDTLAERRRRTIEALSIAAFNRRLQRLTNQPGTALIGASAVQQQREGTARLTTLKVIAQDGAWKPALTAAEQEIRRAQQHGFTESELQTVVEQGRGAVHGAAAQAASRTNMSIANAILTAGATDQFVTTPAFRAATYDSFVRGLKPADLQNAFRDAWTGSAPLIHLTTKTPIARQDVTLALSYSRKTAVSAPPESKAAAFAYDRFGTPGKVASDKRVAELGVRQIRFRNNVSLTLKKTKFEPGKVRFMVRLGDGELDLPRDKPGLGLMMSLTSAAAGLGKHSTEDLQEILAGKSVRLGSSVTDDAFVAGGTTATEDLPLQMKVSAAYLLDPGFRAEAQAKWLNALPMLERELDSQPETVANSRLPALLADGDTRFGVPGDAALRSRTFAEAKAAITPLLAKAPIDVTIVGDFDEATAIGAVAQTFGALPARAPEAGPLADSQSAHFRRDPSPILLYHDGRPDKAMIQIAWPTTDDSKFEDVVGLALLKDVLNLKLMQTIRAQLGDTYAPTVKSVMSDVFPGFGYLSVSAIVAPEKADEVETAIQTAATELRTTLVSDDLLARARNPELARADKGLQDNGYWLAALIGTQKDPRRLDRITGLRGSLERVTAADIQRLAQKYLVPAASRKALILSRKTLRIIPGS